MNENTYSYIGGKNINIKLLNGTIFSIEIGELDDNDSFLNHICDYDKSLRIRKNRMRMFLYKDDKDDKDEKDEKDDKDDKNDKNDKDDKDDKDEKFYQYQKEDYKEDKDKYNINISDLNDNDTLCILSDTPPYPLIFENNYIYNIDNIEKLYDTIDSLYYQNYKYIQFNDNDLGFKFNLSLRKDIMQNIDFFIENIPFEECKHVIFKSDIANSPCLVTKFVNFLEKSSCFSLKTLDISEIESSFIDSMRLFSAINNDKIYIENIYIDFRFLYKPLYIKTQNLYIKNCKDEIYRIMNNNLLNKSHIVYIDNYYINDNNIYNIYNIYPPKDYYKLGYTNKFFMYKHISIMNDTELFDNYELL